MPRGVHFGIENHRCWVDQLLGNQVGVGLGLPRRPGDKRGAARGVVADALDVVVAEAVDVELCEPVRLHVGYQALGGIIPVVQIGEAPRVAVVAHIGVVIVLVQHVQRAVAVYVVEDHVEENTNTVLVRAVDQLLQVFDAAVGAFGAKRRRLGCNPSYGRRGTPGSA